MKLKPYELCKINGASGNESEVISYIKSEFGGRIDNLGSLIIGDGKIAIAAITDEKGIFVSESGEKIRLCPISSAKPAELINRKISFSGGATGFVCCDKDLGDAKLSDLYVTADSEPQVGKIGCIADVFTETDEFYITKAYARTATCLVAEKLMGSKNTKLMFTTMFYNGKKGLNAALYNERPSYTVVIDTINADGDKIKLGDGTAVKMMEGSYTADARLREFLKTRDCQRAVIKTPEVRCANSTSFGANTAIISVPVKYMGGYVGKIMKSDIEKTAEFIKEFVKTIY